MSEFIKKNSVYMCNHPLWEPNDEFAKSIASKLVIIRKTIEGNVTFSACSDDYSRIHFNFLPSTFSIDINLFKKFFTYVGDAELKINQ